MSLFNNWFSVKTKPRTGTAAEGAGVAAPSAAPDGAAASRKTIRLQQRELLYSTIREAMIHAGVLSTGYQFKVLSLDSQGRQYLVMVDLVRDGARDVKQLAEIETQIMQSAQALHDILVTAVYWRANEHPAAGRSLQAQPPASTAAPGVWPARTGEVAAAVPAELKSRSRDDEGADLEPVADMAARREALSSPDFEDTVIESPQDPAPPRKATPDGGRN